MKNRLFAVTILLAAVMFAAPAFAQISQPITLKAGFNFISFTTAVSITPQQFLSLNSGIEDIYLYSALAGSFLSYKEGTLSSLAAGRGYIVKTSADATISVSGPAISTIGNISVKSGFNLIGFSKLPAPVTFSTLMAANTTVKGIYKWNPAIGAFLQVVRDASGAVVQLDGTDPSFKAGEAYFFNMASDTTINYDGASILIGASPIDPNAKAAEIAGTINSAAGMAELGLNYQAAGDAFSVTLVDSDGNTVPAASLDAGETNPKTVNDGQPYSFKVKDFTKAYKVIAQSKTVANKMVSVFVGKVKAEEKITNRDVTPISTAISMIYADPTKEAAAFKAEEEAKKADANFQKRIAPFVSDLEAKRQAVLKDQTYDTPEKLERAYKDAVVGSLDPLEIAKVKEGLDAVIGKLEAQLTMLQKLKDTLALIATSGQRQNESNVKKAQSKLAEIITATEGVAAEQSVNTDAKISYGLVCSDLGDIFKNNVNTGVSSASSARSLMAAYQIMSDETNAQAEAEYKKGYDMVKNLSVPETDTTGRDKSLAAAVLKNASALAKKDPAKLDEAKQKADVLLSKLETEGTLAVQLPTGEIINKDKILEKKGESLINAGRPSEAVEVFQGVSEEKIKNFGLGRAFLGLNDIENAYKNLKDAVKTVVKSDKSSELRMSVEQNFPKVNEALFAFAAVVDKIKNAPATDAALTAVKNRLITLEQGAASETDKILVDNKVTVGKIIQTIKPATNFFAVGKKLVLDNPTQQNFGQQFVDLTESTDSVRLAFNKAMALLFNANKIIDAARTLVTLQERQKLIYAGAAGTGTVDNPAAETVLKLLAEANNAFEAIVNNAAAANQLKGDARFQTGLAFLAQYRAFKIVELENKELIGLAKKIFLEIREKINEAQFAHLAFAVAENIRNIENIEKQNEGVIAEAGSPLEMAETLMKRAMNFYNGKEFKLAAEQFQKAFEKYDEAYNSVDAKITVKMKEAALYYGALCLHYKYRLLSVKDEVLKVKLLERLKLFRLKFPESNFVNMVRDIINELESNIAMQMVGEVGINTLIDNKPRPGDEFNKALAMIEKLRLYYNNNFSTTEIEAVFAVVETILKDITENLSTDPKYVGNITAADDLKALRAVAKFRRAIMYMERYLMHKLRDVNHKNMALKLLCELITEFPEQPFIEEAKRFVLQLQNEGQVVDQFVEGRPIFVNVSYSPRLIELASNALREVNIAIDVKVPDTTAVDLISEVKVALKRFGNPVYLDDAAQTAVVVALAKNASNQNRWEGKLNLNFNIAAGDYDAIVTAVTKSGIRAEAIFPVIVKGAAELAKIKMIEIVDGTTLKAVVDGAGYAVYASVMQPNAVFSMFDNKLMPITEVPANVKLDAVTGEAGKFVLDIKTKLSNLKAGNYIFLFKLISSTATDIEAALNAPVHLFQFPFFVKREISDTLKSTIDPVYRNILTNFNDLSKTAAERMVAYERMFVIENFTMNAAKREAWIKLMDSLDNFKVSVVDEPFIEYDPNLPDRVIVRVPWKIEGKYKVDMLKGLFTPDGAVLLPPGKIGFALQNFFIKTEHYFVKTLDGSSWGLTVPDAAVTTNQTVVAPTDKKPVIAKIGGIAIPADGSAAKLGDLTINPFAVIEGVNLNALAGEKRVIKVHNPKLMVPLFLCDNGSPDWADTAIKFNTAPLKGISGPSKIELFDSKYGTLLAFPVEFSATSTPVAPKVVVTEIISGNNASNPFGLIRPFEIDRTKELKLKGDAMLPASGTYSLKYFKAGATEGTGSFVEIFKSGAAGWGANEITVPAASLPTAENIADYKATSLVIWDDTANKAASSQMLVLFKGAAPAPAAMVINTVNAQPADGVVTLTPEVDKQLVVTGKNLKHPNKMRLDFLFFVNTAIEVVPIAFNDAAGWGGDTISVAIDWTKLADKIKLGAVMVVFDELQRVEVSPRVKIRFNSSVTPQPSGFVLTSPSFPAGGTIPVEFTGAGANVSPELRWTGFPTGTASFALICEDPTHDAANPYIHWVIYAIPGDFTGLPKAVPNGATAQVNNATLKQLETYNKKVGYDGPNPPAGEVHVYNFKLYALKAAPGPLVNGMVALRAFIATNAIGEPAVLRGVFFVNPVTPPAGTKFFKLITAPAAVPAAPSFQGAVPTTVPFDPAKHAIKVYDQLSGKVYPATGDPTNPASYSSQIPIDGTPKIIVEEIIDKVNGDVLARNIVGKCPLVSEVPASVSGLELKNPPIDIKTTIASMLAFEKLGNNLPNLPAFDFANMTPDAAGNIIKSMQPNEVSAFTAELQKAIGGAGVIDNIILARQGVKEAQSGVAQMRTAADQIPINIPEPYASQNKAVRDGLLSGATMIENCMAGIKNALKLVPDSNIPNPAATTELLKAYVTLLNEIPKIKEHFISLSRVGIQVASDMFDAVPSSIILPGPNGNVTIDKNTTAAQIAEIVKSIPVVRQ